MCSSDLVVLNYIGIVWLGAASGGMASKYVFTLLGCGALIGTGFVWKLLRSMDMTRLRAFTLVSAIPPSASSADTMP